MNAVFTPSRGLREYMRDRLDKTVRARPGFGNVEWWDGDMFMVAHNRHGKTKRCSGCDVLKPTTAFCVRRKRNSKPYVSNLCKPCEAARRRAWRLAVKEAV